MLLGFFYRRRVQVFPQRGAFPGAEQEVRGAQEDPLQDPGRDHGQEDVPRDHQVRSDNKLRIREIMQES